MILKAVVKSIKFTVKMIDSVFTAITPVLILLSPAALSQGSMTTRRDKFEGYGRDGGVARNMRVKSLEYGTQYDVDTCPPGEVLIAWETSYRDLRQIMTPEQILGKVVPLPIAEKSGFVMFDCRRAFESPYVTTEDGQTLETSKLIPHSDPRCQPTWPVFRLFSTLLHREVSFCEMPSEENNHANQPNRQ